RAIRALPVERCLIDGEVVVLDAAGRPSFARLQRRGRLQTVSEVRHAAVELPATFYAFDLIGFADYDLRPLPLLDRKKLLAKAIPSLGPVRYLDHVAREGRAFLASVSAMSLEGMIAKKADARYVAGRTSNWLKIKAEPTDDFV